MRKIVKKSLLILTSVLLVTSCSTSNVKTVDKDELIKDQKENVDTEEKIDEVVIDSLPQIEMTIPPPKKRPKQRLLSKAERFSGMLEAHNKIRLKHKVPPLKWSKKLEDYSMEWAKNLSRRNKCEMFHRPSGAPFGENLYRSTAIVWSDGVREVSPVTIKDVVKAWTDEEQWYDYKNNSCQPGQQCGHYTQAVWNTTTEVGCAMQVCGDKSQTWVCSYNPPGNYRGMRPY